MTKEQIIRLLQDTIDGLNGKDNGFENVDVLKKTLQSVIDPNLKKTQYAVFINFETADMSSGAED